LLTVKLKNKSWRMRFYTTYGDVATRNMLALIGSHDFLEIAVNQGNASKKFKTKAGDAVTVSLKH